MIAIKKYSELSDDFFNGRDFGGSIDIVKDVLVEQGYCTKKEVEELLVPEKMTKPNYMTKA